MLSQLTDPFRIGLIFFLLLTALRTRATTGFAMPLAFGIVFIAILLPMTTERQAGTDGTLPVAAMAAGIASNAIVLGVLLLGRILWLRTQNRA